MPEPTTLEPPVQPTPEPHSPSPALEDFDKTFSDLEPTPTPTPNAPVPETTRTIPPKDPETGQFTKPEKTKDDGANRDVSKPNAPSQLQVGGKSEDGTVAVPVKPSGPEFEPPQVAKPSELRSWAKRMGTRAEQAEQNLSRLNAKIRDLESRPQQQADTKALTDELAATKKRLEEYEGELKVTRYERSGEYKEKYEKPYQNAVRNAYAEVGELLVNVPNPEDPENPRERQATTADFDEVYQLPLGPATKLAKQKFGDAAPIVIQHVKAIKDAAKAAMGAIEEHKGKAAEFEQQQTAQQRLEQEGRSQMFSQAVQAIAEKYPTCLVSGKATPHGTRISIKGDTWQTWLLVTGEDSHRNKAPSSTRKFTLGSVLLPVYGLRTTHCDNNLQRRTRKSRNYAAVHPANPVRHPWTPRATTPT